MLNICLSMSKYPLGSHLGGTGDWGGDWWFRVGIGLLRTKRMSFYVKVSFRALGSNLGGTEDWGGDWGFRVGIGLLKSFTC